MTDQITVSRELLRQVLDTISLPQAGIRTKEAVKALRAALAEPAPAQEPIGWYWEYNGRPEGKVFFGKAPDQDVIERGLSAEFPCIVRYVYTSPQAPQAAPVQEPVAWWKQYPDGSISVVESRTFLADDAVATGWSALRFADTAPQAQQPAPQAQQTQLLTDEEIKDAIRHLYQDETSLQMSIDITLHEFRAIEQAVHRKLRVVE